MTTTSTPTAEAPTTGEILAAHFPEPLQGIAFLLAFYWQETPSGLWRHEAHSGRVWTAAEAIAKTRQVAEAWADIGARDIESKLVWGILDGRAQRYAAFRASEIKKNAPNLFSVPTEGDGKGGE